MAADNLSKIAAGYVQFRLSQGDSVDDAVVASEHKLGIVLTSAQKKAAVSMARAGLKAAFLAKSATPETTIGQLYPTVRDTGQKVSLRFRVQRQFLTREEAEAMDAAGVNIKVVRSLPPSTKSGVPQRYLCLVTTLLPSIPAVHPSQE